MNKQLQKLQLYSREQQIKYLELQAKIDSMLLKLSNIQNAESSEYHSDDLDMIVQLPLLENVCRDSQSRLNSLI
ncbi:MAG: hypothetical protein AAF652_07165 [Cyanobacteria bacterium P01_C01_bin.72]